MGPLWFNFDFVTVLRFPYCRLRRIVIVDPAPSVEAAAEAFNI